MRNIISFYNVELCCTTLCFKTIIQILANFSVLAPPTCDISIGTCTATSSAVASTAILVDLAECLCMRHAGVHWFQVHAGAFQRMLNKCWRIRLYPSAPGRMIPTTIYHLCRIMLHPTMLHFSLPRFHALLHWTRLLHHTIPSHISLPLLLLLPLLFQSVVRWFISHQGVSHDALLLL